MESKVEQIAKEQLLAEILDMYYNERLSPSRDLHATDKAVQKIDALYNSPTLKAETQVVCPKTDKCIRSKPRPCGHDEPHKIRSNCDKAGLCPACIPVPSTPAKPETHLICPKPCKDHPKCECRVPHIENEYCWELCQYHTVGHCIPVPQPEPAADNSPKEQK